MSKDVSDLCDYDDSKKSNFEKKFHPTENSISKNGIYKDKNDIYKDKEG